MLKSRVAVFCERAHAVAVEDAAAVGEPAPPAQLVDDAFVALVWRRLAALPSVRVGIMQAPDADALKAEEEIEADEADEEVKPAKKGKKAATSKSRKADREKLLASRPAFVELDEKFRQRPLEELVADFGDDLRIGVDEDSAWVAITGFSQAARPTRLTQLVFDVAQAVVSGRSSGLTMVEIGQVLGYDQRSLFHFVRTLVELNLVCVLRAS